MSIGGCLAVLDKRYRRRKTDKQNKAEQLAAVDALAS
jgi:hypothetical protein